MEPDPEDEVADPPRTRNWIGVAAVACGLLSLALPVVTVTTNQAVDHLGWTFLLGVAAVVLGALGLVAARRGRVSGTGSAAAGLGTGIVGAGVSGIVLGLLHVSDALGDWFFQNVTF